MKKNIYLLLLLVLSLSVALITGCSSGNTNDQDHVVVVGSKPFTEGYLVSELIAIMLEENSDLKIERRMGIQGGTSNLHPAMLSGDIDIYPEYTGTGWMFVLGNPLISDSEEIFQEVKKQYLKDFDIVWLEPFGFNNTFTLAIKEELAAARGIKTFSDLANISSEFTFGAEYDFYERDDGFNALVDTYGFAFANTREMDIGLKYQAIDQNEVQVINAFSTDGALKLYHLAILEDNENFFPPYHAAPLIRKSTLDKHPQIAEILNNLATTIDEITMIDLNYKVDVEKMDANVVAREFLESQNLIQ